MEGRELSQCDQSLVILTVGMLNYNGDTNIFITYMYVCIVHT